MEVACNLGTNVIFKSLDHNMIFCTFRNVGAKTKIEAGAWTVKEVVPNLKKMGPKKNIGGNRFYKMQAMGSST